MTGFHWSARSSVDFGAGKIADLGAHARALGFEHSLLVADAGVIQAGLVDRAARALAVKGITSWVFDGFGENPDSVMVEAGRLFAEPLGVDSIIGVGGGSSMDCAKGINFVLTNGGRMQDYWGYGKASKAMLPMIGIPTTTGTGSEAQSYTLISDADTHVKMACGAPGAAFRLVILDPELVVSQPPKVLAAAGYDAVSHAVESFVTANHNHISDCFSRESWRLLSSSFERLLADPGCIQAASNMQVGAYLAGCAIECSMLGAAHACANPLTARHGTVHGVAIALLLRHVVEWNRPSVEALYRELHADLPARLEELALAASLPRRLRDIGIDPGEITLLAEDASKQWTGRFNPRPFDASAAQEIYQCAY